ncbi:hypothetical protein QYF36_019939 [Acer negundo]|nr:hypothetical protein QYF36_019939 [Acer negundo]
MASQFACDALSIWSIPTSSRVVASSYFVKKCGCTDNGSGSQPKRKFGESSLEVIPAASDCDVEGTPSGKTANNSIVY